MGRGLASQGSALRRLRLGRPSRSAAHRARRGSEAAGKQRLSTCWHMILAIATHIFMYEYAHAAYTRAYTHIYIYIHVHMYLYLCLYVYI